MGTLMIAMIVGIAFAFAKVALVSSIIWVKTEKMNWISHQIDQKIISWVVGSFVLEIVFAIGIKFFIDYTASFDEILSNQIIELLTSVVSIGWISFFAYTLYKIIFKIYCSSSLK